MRQAALIALFVCGCGPGTTSVNTRITTAGGSFLVDGRFDPWTAAPGDRLAAAVNLGGHYTVLADTGIDDDGSFKLQVANQAAAQPLEQPLAFFFIPTDFGIVCTSTPPMPPALTVAMIDIFVKDAAGTLYQVGFKPALRFVESAAGGDYQGSEQCTGDTAMQVGFALHLGPGYSVLLYSTDDSGTSSTITSATRVDSAQLTATF